MSAELNARREVASLALFVGIVLHCIFSLIWVVSFMAGLTAFNSGEGVPLAKVLSNLHSLFYFPIILVENPKDPAGWIGPFPSFATVGWCFLVGLVIVKVCRLSRNPE